MLGPSIYNHRRTCAGAATPLGRAASKLLRLRTIGSRMQQVRHTAHVSMKHICLKSLQVGRGEVARVIITRKTEDGFGDFELRKAQVGESGHDFLCGNFAVCGPRHPHKSAIGTEKSRSTR